MSQIVIKRILVIPDEERFFEWVKTLDKTDQTQVARLVLTCQATDVLRDWMLEEAKEDNQAHYADQVHQMAANALGREVAKHAVTEVRDGYPDD